MTEGGLCFRAFDGILFVMYWYPQHTAVACAKIITINNMPRNFCCRDHGPRYELLVDIASALHIELSLQCK